MAETEIAHLRRQLTEARAEIGGLRMTNPKAGDVRDAARIVEEIDGTDNGTDPFAAAVRATRMPMAISNPRLPDNPIVYVNDAFCRLTDYPREEIVGRNCRFLQGLDTNRETVASLRLATKNMEPIQTDILNYRKNGEQFWNRLLMAPVSDAQGELAYFFASQVDVTLERERLEGLENHNAALMVEVSNRLHEQQRVEVKLRELNETLEQRVEERTAELRMAEGSLRDLNEKLEERVEERTKALMEAESALRQSQKMEAVGQLTGGLAHDFNNLLAGISGSLELLSKRVAQGRTGELDRYIVAAKGASKRAAALTHRLLAFSRRQTLDPKPTDVNRLVASIADLIRRTAGPAITVDTVDAVGLWTALVDSHQLENALLNLCINARDAMPDGGRLTIETANRWMDDRVARERDLPPGQYLSLCVSDTGTGMSPDVIARAFDPFFTTKPIGQGTGLGLSMVYGFARQSGGQTRIYSEVGQGSTMCIYLPRHSGSEEVLDALVERGLAARAEQGETVLVVDDEATIRMLVCDVLGDLGYGALEAEDGPSGLKVLRSDVRIDLLVTDVGLPNGMNGRQVADAARMLRPGLKVLFITGYAENAAVGNGHLDPGMAVLTKPFAMDDLANRIRTLIET